MGSPAAAPQPVPAEKEETICKHPGHRDKPHTVTENEMILLELSVQFQSSRASPGTSCWVLSAPGLKCLSDEPQSLL